MLASRLATFSSLYSIRPCGSKAPEDKKLLRGAAPHVALFKVPRAPSLPLPHSPTHTPSLSLSLSLSHTPTHTPSLSLSLSLSHTHTLTLSLSLSHTHTHTLPLSLSHTHTLPLSLSLSLSHTHTHSLSRLVPAAREEPRAARRRVSRGGRRLGRAAGACTDERGTATAAARLWARRRSSYCESKSCES
jgi:hypothetical protein